jgi:hypothetical protein
MLITNRERRSDWIEHNLGHSGIVATQTNVRGLDEKLEAR